MKNLKNLSLLLMITLCTGFISCSDDDENINSDLLVGKWKAVQYEGWEKGNDGSYDDLGDSNPDLYTVINTDGTGYDYESTYPNDKNAFTWTLSGNKIHLIYTHNSEEGIMTIVSLTSDQLIVEAKEVYTDEGVKYTFYRKATFKRIQD